MQTKSSTPHDVEQILYVKTVAWSNCFGIIIYRAIIALSLKLGMNASDLKLITSILVVIIIYLKLKKESLKKGGVVNA